MKKVSALDFDNLRDYLRYQVEKSLKSSSGRKVSNLGKVARNLGYRSPSLLSMVLKGQRLPSDDLISAMSETWKLGASESEFLRLLVVLERQKKKGRDTTEILTRLRKLGARKKAFTISANQFALMRDWHYLVIKQLVASPDFVDDPAWISRKLRRKISPAQAQRALEVMVELGMLERAPGTGKITVAVGYTETEHELPSEAIRLHHRGMIERAAEALEEQAVDQRHFNSLTLKIDPRRIPEIKERLLEFLRGFNAEYETGESSRVYQLNLQFFEHTRAEASSAGGESHATH